MHTAIVALFRDILSILYRTIWSINVNAYNDQFKQLFFPSQFSPILEFNNIIKFKTFGPYFLLGP